MANIFSHITNILNTNQIFRSITNSKGTKVYISNTFSSTEPDNFLFQYHLYFYTNLIVITLNL